MYTPTIGLEIHAELLTESKLFCGCRNNPNDDEPNMHTCPVCVGYPGSLPVINRRAVEHILRIGVALNGSLAKRSRFDRKHYFYPDIPKGYQISQYPYPLVTEADLNGIGIERVHLEEDTAKNLHDMTQGSVIDFNRSGVPLMELVTKPVFHASSEVKDFCEMLQLTLRHLGASQARMEWGEMRVEVNISLSDTDTLGTKVEVKNLNSFRSVCSAIEFEIGRQTEILGQGGRVDQETRGWNENTDKTFSQRLKETSEEYRYMPEPDLPEYHFDRIPEWSAESLRKSIPELPMERRRRYTGEIGLSQKQADVLVRHRQLADILDYVTASSPDTAQLTANYLVSDVLQYTTGEHAETLYTRVTPEAVHELMVMLSAGEISSRGAKDILGILVRQGDSPRAIAEEHNLFQRSDEAFLNTVIEKVVADHESVAEEYRSGKEEVLRFLIGQVMKETKGTANPGKAGDMLRSRLRGE